MTDTFNAQNMHDSPSHAWPLNFTKLVLNTSLCHSIYRRRYKSIGIGLLACMQADLYYSNVEGITGFSGNCVKSNRIIRLQTRSGYRLLFSKTCIMCTVTACSSTRSYEVQCTLEDLSHIEAPPISVNGWAKG